MSTDTSPTLDPADTDEPVDEPVFTDTVLLADTITEDSTEATPGAALRRRRPWYRPRWKPLFLRLHRWISFAFLIPVLLWFGSGAVVEWGESIGAAANPSMVRGTESAHPLTAEQAAQVVRTAFPDDLVTVAFRASLARHSAIQVTHRSPDGTEQVSAVDPGTGKIRATQAPGAEAETAGYKFRDFVSNLHDCALGCDSTGYLPFMAKIFPGTTWPLYRVVVTVVGFATAFLAVSGLVLWWPGLKRWTRGFRLRRKSFYIFNFDLHHVLGFAAIPFVLMWGLTTMSFYLPQMQSAWMAVTRTQFPTPAEFDEQVAALSAAEGATGPEISVAEAESRARAVAQGEAEVCWLYYPDPDNGSNAYLFVFSTKYHACWTGVFVNLKGGETTLAVGHGRPWSETVWSYWHVLHDGWAVNAWGRSLWTFFGLAPVVLTFTGVVMWWRRWRNRRRRRTAALTAEATA